MDKGGNTRNYTWLLHIAIWVVLFGMPFFSPRPGHPLHGGEDYTRFVVPLISFFIVFYVNYFLLIKKYLYDRKFVPFIIWNVLLIAAVGIAVHVFFQNGFPAPQDGFRPEFDRGGPGRPHGPEGGPEGVPGRPQGPRPGHGPRPKPWLDNLGFFTRNVVIYLGVIGMAVAVRMTERWYKDENKRREMEKAAAETELAALKSQVNPHFLFNTLNNIYSLIQIDQDKAQEAVHDLSGMLRYVLYDSEKPSVALSDETAFLRDYIKLMSMRCSPDVKIDISLPDSGSDRQIAPLLFIPLVENAFKHGISPNEPSSITVDLHEDGECVVCMVENTAFPKDDNDRSGSGIGIKNLCRRLNMLYPGHHSFEYGKTGNLYRCLLKINTSENIPE